MNPRPKRLSSIDRQDLRIRNEGKCEERWQRKEKSGQRRASAAHVTCKTALVRDGSAYDTPVCCGVSNLRSGTYFTAGCRVLSQIRPRNYFSVRFSMRFSIRFSACFSVCLVIHRYAVFWIVHLKLVRRCTICWKDSLFKDIVEQYLGRCERRPGRWRS
jgi:hypothetical protein